ncbi:MAG: hemerythrin family protein [Gammaproteobacteria bacterium]|nr:hemerythrin family protein [Gammaproteobacteria bacterium]NNL50305.1 hemerythrin family protein [Woeseiaceae bacterium]
MRDRSVFRGPTPSRLPGSVGVAAVDFEHRELIELINGLDVDMQGYATKTRVVETLGEIYARISAHFALEEKIMRDANYDGYATHKQDHELLLDEMLNIIDSVDDAGRYDRTALSRSLDSWFSGHFRTHDARLHQRLG